MSVKDKKDDEYWEGKSNLQYVKHDIIESYLNGWFPRLGTWNGKILYFDTHAGRGSHQDGGKGSPLVAVHTLLNHSYGKKLLQRCEVNFLFMEKKKENLASLNEEIKKLGKLPENLKIHTACTDCFEELKSIVDSLKKDKKRLAPAFVFVDPYGYKIPGKILKELMTFDRVELFVNVIWRELNMSMKTPTGKHADNLDMIFGSKDWRTDVRDGHAEERVSDVISLFKKTVDAKWATAIRMKTNNLTRYFLVHFTNHDSGRDLMKDCMWKVCPGGGFYANKEADPNQGLLLSSEPDLGPLEEWVLQKLETPMKWSELTDLVLHEDWRSVHLNKVVRKLRKAKQIQGKDYKGKFSNKANPVLFKLEKS